MLLVYPNGINVLIRTSMSWRHGHFSRLRLERLFTTIDSIHLVCLAIPLIESAVLTVCSGMVLGKGLVIRVHCLVDEFTVSRTIGSIHLALEAVLTALSSAVTDIEETASSDTEADDYEGKDWDGNYQAQVYVGAACRWCGERHAGGEERFGEYSRGRDGELITGGCWEVAIVPDGF
jgi:hypothetical protein